MERQLERTVAASNQFQNGRMVQVHDQLVIDPNHNRVDRHIVDRERVMAPRHHGAGVFLAVDRVHFQSEHLVPEHHRVRSDMEPGHSLFDRAGARRHQFVGIAGSASTAFAILLRLHGHFVFAHDLARNGRSEGDSHSSALRFGHQQIGGHRARFTASRRVSRVCMRSETRQRVG